VTLPDGDNDHGHPKIEATLEEIVSILAGPKVHHFGGPDTRDDGLVAKVDKVTTNQSQIMENQEEMWGRITNGRGFKVDLPAWSKVVGFILSVLNVVLVVLLILHQLGT
jgi:hypothetical protein